MSADPSMHEAETVAVEPAAAGAGLLGLDQPGNGSSDDDGAKGEGIEFGGRKAEHVHQGKQNYGKHGDG